MNKLIIDFQLHDKIVLNKEFFLLILRSPIPLPQVLPGQFAEILIPNNPNVFLRRPFSFHDLNYHENTVTFLIQIKGEATKQLFNINPNEKINLIYPLGNSFSIPETNDILLIGGGCGIAPLLLLAKEIYNKGLKSSILIGARSNDYLLRLEEYSKYGTIYTTTEDGSYGEKGYVIHHSVLWRKKINISKIYCCGPDVMMRAVSKYASKNNIECEVSLENLMACGIGACLCCITATKQGNKCVCTDGPVFKIKELLWEV